MPGACSLTHRVEMHLDRWKHVLAFVLTSRRLHARHFHTSTHIANMRFFFHIWVPLPGMFDRLDIAGYVRVLIKGRPTLQLFPYAVREVLGFFISSIRFCLIIMIFQCHFFNLPREDNFYLEIEQHHNCHTISLENSLVLQYSISSLCLQPVIAPFGFSILLQLMPCCIRVHFLAVTWPVEHFVSKE